MFQVIDSIKINIFSFVLSRDIFAVLMSRISGDVIYTLQHEFFIDEISLQIFGINNLIPTFRISFFYIVNPRAFQNPKKEIRLQLIYKMEEEEKSLK